MPSDEISIKKLPTSRKRPGKDPSSVKDEPSSNTFPRKLATRTKSLFDNDFILSDESPIIKDKGSKFNFDNDFDKPDVDASVTRSMKGKHAFCGFF